MTRDEILAMPSGREMDVLIAKKLDLFRKHPKQGDYFLTENHIHIGYVPQFSTDISAAWEVVDKFYSMTLDKYSDGSEWRVYLVTERDGKNVDAHAVADTAALAICRAALLAVMK